MIKKFKKHLNLIFLFYPKTKRLKEFKEELLGTLMEYHQENINNGMDEEKSFKICIKHIDDYKETIGELANQKSEDLTGAQRKIILLTALTYILGVIFVYFVISLTTRAWNITWLTFIGGIIIGLIGVFFLLLKLSKKNSQYVLARCSIFILSLLLTTLIYLIVSYSIKQIWHISWVTFLIGIVIAYVIDIIYRFRKKVSKFAIFDFASLTALSTIIVYFIVNFTIVNAWAWSWVIFIGGLFTFAFGLLIKKIIAYGKLEK